MKIEVAKIEPNCYRLHWRGLHLTVDAAAMCELMDWCSLHRVEMEREAKAAMEQEAASKGLEWDDATWHKALRETRLSKDDEQVSNPWQAAADHIFKAGDKNIYRDEPDWGTR